MEWYILTVLISYLGIGVGICISAMTKEELKPGRKYFLIIHAILPSIIISMTMSVLISSYYLVLGIVIFIILMYVRNPKSSYIIYPLLGFLLSLSKTNVDLLMITSSMIFLYGLPTAALLVNFKKKNFSYLFLYHLPFLIAALLP